MKHLLAVGILSLFACSTAINAQSTETPAPATPAPAPVTTPAPKHRPIVFHPPADASEGVMPIRVGGGSRASSAGLATIRVLVPQGKGETTEAQPTIYFYLSKPAKTYCEITLTEPKHPKPLLAKITPVSDQSGILAIRLSKYDVELKPGTTYKWSVAVVVDPQSRSQDLVAYGVIKRVEPTPALVSQLAQAADADKPAIYAENGLWYDALQSISEQIAKSPGDASLRTERAELLKQVDISPADVAEASSK
jgi:hypothetical protein